MKIIQYNGRNKFEKLEGDDRSSNHLKFFKKYSVVQNSIYNTQTGVAQR